MGETRPRRVQPDQARCFRRGEDAGGKPGYRRGGQVRAVGGRGEQQRGPRRPGRAAYRAVMIAVSCPASGSGSAAQQRPASGSAAIIFASSISASGLPGRLGKHLFAGPATRRARLRVKEPAGVRQAQRWQQQLREVPLKTSRRHVPAGADQQHELF